MSRFVLDCSVTMSWGFEDEAAGYPSAILDALAAGEALVPTIWPLEVANALVVAERRKRLTRADTTTFIGILGRLPIVVIEESLLRTLVDVLDLSRRTGLSAYDAASLHLAAVEGVALATQDGTMLRAAKRVGVARMRA